MKNKKKIKILNDHTKQDNLSVQQLDKCVVTKSDNCCYNYKHLIITVNSTDGAEVNTSAKYIYNDGWSDSCPRSQTIFPNVIRRANVFAHVTWNVMVTRCVTY